MYVNTITLKITIKSFSFNWKIQMIYKTVHKNINNETEL